MQITLEEPADSIDDVCSDGSRDSGDSYGSPIEDTAKSSDGPPPMLRRTSFQYNRTDSRMLVPP